MARMPKPKLLYPIGLRGEETSDAVSGTCITNAKKKFAVYQRRYGNSYYLMGGVPYEQNIHRYHEFMPDVTAASANKPTFYDASAAKLALQAKVLHQCGGD